MSRNMGKQALRKEYKKVRACIGNREELDRKILDAVISLEEYRQAGLLLTYVSVGEEVDTRQLIADSLSDGKKVAVPKCEGEDIVFYYIESPEELRAGRFGIPEPTVLRRVTHFENSICIVPGIAFDREGNRIGYGAGFYDRFLKDYPGIKIGISYAPCICEKIDADLHDIKMDRVVHNNLNNHVEVCYGGERRV